MRGRRDIRPENGQTAVEFALVLPIIAVILLAVIQLGIAFHDYVTLTDAARAGARKAIVLRLAGGPAPTDISCYPATATTASNPVCQAVNDAAGGLDQSKLQVNVSSTDWTQGGSTVTVTATYPYTLSLLAWMGKWAPWGGQYTLTSTMKERLE